MTKKRELNVWVVDRNADIYAPMIRGFLRKDGKYEPHAHFLDHGICLWTQENQIDLIQPSVNPVVLCDVVGNMAPEYNGKYEWKSFTPEDAVTQIRNRDSKAKVIIFTGSEFSKADARDAGADGYLHKTRMYDIRDRRPKLVRIIDAVAEGVYRFH